MEQPINISNTYRKRYKMRSVGQDGLNTVVSMPRAVIEREASKRGLSVEEFFKQFRAVALYNSFEGLFYTFEQVKEEQPQPKPPEGEGGEGEE